jgi:hypothetical protein
VWHPVLPAPGMQALARALGDVSKQGCPAASVAGAVKPAVPHAVRLSCGGGWTPATGILTLVREHSQACHSRMRCVEIVLPGGGTLWYDCRGLAETVHSRHVTGRA